MNNKIGLEIHTTLNTKSKLFCSCKNHTTASANTDTCEICLGHPGSKPRPNKEAVKQIIKLAKLLRCDIREELIFSRKSYFYPDLAKNYQITQYEEPIAENGYLAIDDKKIRIERIHLEEDPAKIKREHDKTYVDYNRSGSPLAEIVTHPDLQDSEQARAFMKKLRTYLKYAGTYNKGQTLIKADVNVSSENSDYLRAEVKNVTGFKEIQKAIDYEIKRQSNETLEHQETRGWKPDQGITYLMRVKEEESDYGYIYEPDITPVNVKRLKEQIDIPERFENKVQRYKANGVAKDDAKIIAAEPKMAEAFEKTMQYGDADKISKWFRTEINQILNYNDTTLDQTYMTPERVSQILKMHFNDEINDNVATDLLRKLVNEKINPQRYVEKEGLTQINDASELEQIVQDVIEENRDSVQDYKNGEDNALNFLVGQVMKETHGKADAGKAKEIIEDKISN